MRYKRENLENIKCRISSGTGVILQGGGYRHDMGRILLAAALVIALGTMAVFAARQFGISRNVLLAPESRAESDVSSGENGSSGEASDEQQINGFRVSYPFSLNTNEYSVAKYAHSGIDIEAPRGTPVLAAADGTVRICEYKPSYGYYVIIDHIDGYSTLYAHMEGYSVEAGQELKAGDRIGTVGSSGMSTGPHLHFELREDDEPVDPSEYFE